MYKEGEPDYAVPPGATIQEFLETSSMSHEEFSSRLGINEEHLERLISGEAWIDSGLAERLGGLTGIPTKMWHLLEQDYRKRRT